MTTQQSTATCRRRVARASLATIAVLSTVALAACGSTAPTPGGGTTEPGGGTEPGATSQEPGSPAPVGPINAMAVEVHQQFITGATGEGINVLEQCDPAIPEPTWQLVQYTDLQQLAFREASLGSSENDLVFLLDSWSSPRWASLLEPLSAYHEKSPIEDLDGISSELFAPYEQDGEFYGVPIRTTAVVLFYDKTKIATPPATIDELVELAKASAGTNDAGQQQYGIRFSSADDLVAWVRAYGGDLITPDLKLGITDEPAIQALTALHDLYAAGAIPENFASLTADDWLRMEQQGQVAMALRGSTYYSNLNDPDASRLAGNVGVSTFPSVDGEPVDVPAATWYMAIQANADDKDAAWELIRCVSSPASTVSMALNNNIPVRAEAFADPAVSEATDPALREAVEKVVAVARPGLPGFEGQTEAVSLLQEAMAKAVTGQQSPAEAMEAAAAQIQPLLDAATE